MKFLAIILGTALYLKVSGVVLAEIDFNKDIKPILSENCYYCHGPDENKRKAKLRLDDFKDATAEKNGSIAIVPNNQKRANSIIESFLMTLTRSCLLRKQK